jgi:hypothetical protein
VNDTIFNIELSLNELNLILAYLGKQPYENVYTLIENLQKQAQKQAHQGTPNE